MQIIDILLKTKIKCFIVCTSNLGRWAMSWIEKVEDDGVEYLVPAIYLIGIFIIALLIICSGCLGLILVLFAAVYKSFTRIITKLKCPYCGVWLPLGLHTGSYACSGDKNDT